MSRRLQHTRDAKRNVLGGSLRPSRAAGRKESGVGDIDSGGVLDALLARSQAVRVEVDLLRLRAVHVDAEDDALEHGLEEPHAGVGRPRGLGAAAPLQLAVE
eukprot:CAMPEP_0118866096 /NCGR_PEP_ID=MMETSP1163-20130328/10136_1 /TAXON_ID=124430 /ORGANISM="Phaeomonas parva, Strain CCMP2877" /LENGTH=101 /DNA_ID=CAMNT_0006800385 /DNA_START=65 /DNA_END=368 /DNA_ORIENTATION=-